jgi:hypothetical protein
MCPRKHTHVVRVSVVAASAAIISQGSWHGWCAARVLYTWYTSMFLSGCGLVLCMCPLFQSGPTWGLVCSLKAYPRAVRRRRVGQRPTKVSNQRASYELNAGGHSRCLSCNNRSQNRLHCLDPVHVGSGQPAGLSLDWTQEQRREPRLDEYTPTGEPMRRSIYECVVTAAGGAPDVWKCESASQRL